jgi:hypothetical protein
MTGRLTQVDISEAVQGKGRCHSLDGTAPGLVICRALGGTRTPNLLIRSQMLYPLSYERRRTPHSVRHFASGLRWRPRRQGARG